MPISYGFINCKMYFFYYHANGALGQTRTGTPKRARILSPLCLPISPRGLLSISVDLSLFIPSVAQKTQQKYIFISLCTSLHIKRISFI